MKKALLVMAALALPCLGTLAQADVFNMGTGLTSLQTVLVGDAGNAADTRIQTDLTSGYGAVAYDYRISTYEVTAAQYCDFLNHVAVTDSGLKLYKANMDRSVDAAGCNIVRTGTQGNYHYQIGNGTGADLATYGNRAANFVGQTSAMRFANWVNNGQGGASTAENGTYAINGTVVELTSNVFTRSANATWAIATENEWYKAAYYQGNGTYSTYASGSADAAPSHSTATPNTPNSANYLGADPYTVSKVGIFANSASHYGTFDQSGNVGEWTEAILAGTSDGYVHRINRGGNMYGASADISATNRIFSAPSWVSGDATDGIRLVQLLPVPEPSSMIALAGGLLALAGIRRRKS